MFSPLHGTHAEVAAGFFGAAFGGDDEFQRVKPPGIALPAPASRAGTRRARGECGGQLSAMRPSTCDRT